MLGLIRTGWWLKCWPSVQDLKVQILYMLFIHEAYFPYDLILMSPTLNFLFIYLFIFLKSGRRGAEELSTPQSATAAGASAPELFRP